MTAGIIFTVTYLALSQKDVVRDPLAEEQEDQKKSKNVLGQLVAVMVLLLVVSIGGYYWRSGQLQGAATPTSPTATTATQTRGVLGDLTSFTTLGQDILTAVNAGDWLTANSKVNELEYAVQ